MEENMRLGKVALCAVALAGFSLATGVVAQFASQDRLVPRAFAAPQLSDSEVEATLRAQGYTSIQIRGRDGDHVVVTATKQGEATDLIVDGYKTVTDVEFEDGKWSIEALQTDGRKVELTADPITGQVSH
jgi:hypothetical protein